MGYTEFLAKGYRVLFTVLIAAPRLMFRWLPPVILALLAFGVGSLSRPLAISAQDGGADGGQQAEVRPQLIVDTSAARLKPFCLGSQVTVPLLITREIRVAGESDVGRIHLSALSINVSTSDFSVVSAEPATSIPSVSSQLVAGSMTLKALKPGKATITVSAKAQIVGAEIDFYHSPIEVEVKPCRYKVEVKSLWITTIVGANVFLRISAKSDMVMNPTTGLFEDQPSFIWEATTNHIKGCLASHWVYPTLKGNGGSFEGRVKDDKLIVTVQMQALVGAGVLFLCDRPITKNGERITDCSDYPDGVCDPQVPDPIFSPDNKAIMDVAFPLEGGTKSIPQRIQYDSGGANGNVIIKVTPIIN